MRGEAMSYSETFTIPGLPRLNAADYVHWRQLHRERRQWGDLVAVATIGRRPSQPLERARVKLTRISCSSREPDRDNLYHSFKPVLDGLVKCGILLDDKPSVIGTPGVAWERSPNRAGQSIEIEIHGIEETP